MTPRMNIWGIGSNKSRIGKEFHHGEVSNCWIHISCWSFWQDNEVNWRKQTVLWRQLPHFYQYWTQFRSRNHWHEVHWDYKLSVSKNLKIQICFFCREMMIVFVYDTAKCQKDFEDPVDAVLYFHPAWVSPTQRLALVGQLMGVHQFLKNTFAAPSLISLQGGKFVLKQFGTYILVRNSRILVNFFNVWYQWGFFFYQFCRL